MTIPYNLASKPEAKYSRNLQQAISATKQAIAALQAEMPNLGPSSLDIAKPTLRQLQKALENLDAI